MCSWPPQDESPILRQRPAVPLLLRRIRPKQRALPQPQRLTERNRAAKKYFSLASYRASHTARTLDMRRPALLVLAPPHLHRFRVALDPPVLRVDLQLPVYFPRDIGKL